MNNQLIRFISSAQAAESDELSSTSKESAQNAAKTRGAPSSPLSLLCPLAHGRPEHLSLVIDLVAAAGWEPVGQATRRARAKTFALRFALGALALADVHLVIVIVAEDYAIAFFALAFSDLAFSGHSRDLLPHVHVVVVVMAQAAFATALAEFPKFSLEFRVCDVHALALSLPFALAFELRPDGLGLGLWLKFHGIECETTSKLKSHELV